MKTNEAQISMTSSTPDPTAAVKLCHTNTYSSLEQSMSQAAYDSESTLASQGSHCNSHLQTSRFSIDALAFLSKLRMPLLICNSSEDLFFSPRKNQFNIYQELAISFTFCKRLFIESVLAHQTREVCGKDKRSCWHSVIFLEEGRILEFRCGVFVGFFEEHFHHEIAKKELKKA